MPNGWTPADLGASLIAAWDPADPTALVGGALASSLPGAWGSPAMLSTGAAPAGFAADFGPDHQGCMQFVRAAGQSRTFAELPSGDLHIFAVLDFASTSADQVLFGHQTLSTPAIRFAANAGGFATLSVRTRGGGAVNVPLPYRKAAGRFELMEFAYSAAVGTLTVRQNDRTSPAVVGSGGLPFNQLSGARGANFLDAFLGPVLICDRLLSDEEAANLREFLAPWRTRTFYISPAGSDTARGDRPDRAWRTLDKVEQLGFRCRPGDAFVLAAGMQIRRTAKFVPPVDGTAQNRCVLRGEPGGEKPDIAGSRLIQGGWTHDPGGTWSRSDVAGPIMIWISGPAGMATPVAPRPLTQPNTFQYASPVLTVAAEPGVDLNAAQVEVAAGAAFSFYEGSRNHWTFENLRIRHMPHDGFAPQGGTGIWARDVELLYCANDGWGPGGGTDLRLEQFVIRGCGKGRTDNGAAGDGISHHGNASGLVQNGVIELCMKAGIDDERGAQVTYADVTVRDCNHNYRWLNQSSSAAAAGSQSLTRVTISRGPSDFQHGIQIETGLDPGGFIFSADGCTVRSTDPGPPRGAAFELGSAGVSILGCRSEGFASDIAAVGAVLISATTGV
jgi:hypothetical protein